MLQTIPKPETRPVPAGIARYVRPPALIAAALYTLITAVLLIASWYAAGHRFAYPLDDSYIGMAMAKNFALHHVWGVSPWAFSSSDSSLLFPLLIAGTYTFTGVNQVTPLLLSWVFGLLALFAAADILASFLSRTWQTVTLVALVLFTPLFVVGLLGMEHSLQLLLTLLFLRYFLLPTEATGRQHLWPVVTALMVATRYESLFFVVPGLCILLLQRRWRNATMVAIGAAIPVIVYAGFSQAHGGFWLPNSVALKGAQVHSGSLLAMVHNLATTAAHNLHDGSVSLLLVLGACAAGAFALVRRDSRRAIPLLLVVAAGAFHLGTARVGMLFRYEDYLIGAGIVALACAWPALRPTSRRPLFLLTFWLALAGAGALTLRSLSAMHLIPVASRNIAWQQVQMARFVHRFYPNSTVAANDIGAINYFNNVHSFDLIGLANADIFRARRAGRETTAYVAADAAAHHVQIAIVYDSWFADPPPGWVGGPALPSSWIRVGRWTLPPGPVMGDHTVSFYAVDPAAASGLHTALAQFNPTLPAGVTTAWN